MTDLKTALAECVRVVEEERRLAYVGKGAAAMVRGHACDLAYRLFHDHGDELLAAVRDAERYRVLRDDTYIDRGDLVALPNDEMEAAIDAAIDAAIAGRAGDGG